jgi:hypothetical protein
MQHKFLDIRAAASIPFPRQLTPDEEAEIIAQYKAQLDPAQLEAECKELLRLRDQGRLVSAEQVLDDLEDADSKKESA